MPVSLIQVQQDVMAVTQTAPWLANKKSRAMPLSTVTHAIELRLISSPSKADISLLTSAKVSNSFFPVFSICMIPPNGDIVLINNAAGWVPE